MSFRDSPVSKKGILRKCPFGDTYYVYCPGIAMPCYIILYYTIPYHTIPYHIILYHTIPYRTVPYQTIPHHTVPYRTILYHNKLYCLQKVVLVYSLNKGYLLEYEDFSPMSLRDKPLLGDGHASVFVLYMYTEQHGMPS